ncbi:MAG: ArsA family ATPase [Gemmatimonadales bacterium]|nr:MAG: ArsA family ATPase [Gemmatimonadales bacterium]
MTRSVFPGSLLASDGPRILFVGGKGGVGKTTTASALALELARAGRRCLLVSTDPAHSLGDIFGVELTATPRKLRGGLHALELDPDRQVVRYLDQVRENMQGLVRPAMYHEIERQLELSRQAPGAVEAATMDRISQLMADTVRRPRGEGDWDVLVFDTAPTGHTLRLLSLPEIMAAWTDGLLRTRQRSDAWGRALERLSGGRAAEAPGEGDELSYIDQVEEGGGHQDARSRRIREVLLERRRKFTRARRLLLDPAVTAFIWVLIPEKLPILESEKAIRTLDEHRVPVAGMVVNRVLPRGDLGAFLESRRAQEEEYLARIRKHFSRIPRIQVPLLARDVEGMETLEQVGRILMGGERGSPPPG